jgi:TolB-like protein
MVFVLLLILGLAAGTGLPVRAAAATPSLAVLPLQEEGRKDLGDISQTMTMCVTTAFTDGGGFRLVDPGQVQAALAGAQPPAVDPAALGRRVGAQYVLAGTYLPETNLAKGTVTVTVTLRLVESASGKVVRYLLESQDGPSLGSVVAALSRKLAAKATPPATAAPVPIPAVPPAASASAPAAAVPVPAAPSAAQAPAPAPSPAPAAQTPALAPAAQPAAPALAPALQPATPPVPAPAPAPQPAASTPVPAAAPSAPEAAPSWSGRTLLVLREGRVNDVYHLKNGLDRFGVKLEDFAFLLKALARKLPPGAEPAFDIGTKGPGTDFQQNSRLVKDHKPDAMAVLVLECRSKPAGLLSMKSLVQAEVEILFLDPRTLEVTGSKVIGTDFLKAKGIGQTFPQELKDQLAAKIETVTLP